MSALTACQNTREEHSAYSVDSILAKGSKPKQ